MFCCQPYFRVTTAGTPSHFHSTKQAGPEPLSTHHCPSHSLSPVQPFLIATFPLYFISTEKFSAIISLIYPLAHSLSSLFLDSGQFLACCQNPTHSILCFLQSCGKATQHSQEQPESSGNSCPPGKPPPLEERNPWANPPTSLSSGGTFCTVPQKVPSKIEPAGASSSLATLHWLFPSSAPFSPLPHFCFLGSHPKLTTHTQVFVSDSAFRAIQIQILFPFSDLDTPGVPVKQKYFWFIKYGTTTFTSLKPLFRLK